LWQVFAATAEAFPEAIAVDDGRSALNYRGLRERVRRAGDRLAAAGIGGGDRVLAGLSVAFEIAAAWPPPRSWTLLGGGSKPNSFGITSV